MQVLSRFQGKHFLKMKRIMGGMCKTMVLRWKLISYLKAYKVSKI